LQRSGEKRDLKNRCYLNYDASVTVDRPQKEKSRSPMTRVFYFSLLSLSLSPSFSLSLRGPPSMRMDYSFNGLLNIDSRSLGL